MPESKKPAKSCKNVACQGLLPEPIQPGMMKICPSCKRWYALVLQRSEPCDVVGAIDHYRCRECGHETSFARGLPPEAV